MTPLTVLTTTTCPEIFAPLHTSLSLSPSLHSPLAHFPSCSFTQGSAMSLPQCHTIYITRQREAFQSRCSFGSARFPLWFMSSFTTARYKSYDLCTDWGTLITALLILGICARHRGRGYHLTFLSRMNPTD